MIGNKEYNMNNSEDLVLDDDTNLVKAQAVDIAMEDSTIIRKAVELVAKPSIVVLTPESLKKLQNTQVMMTQDQIELRTSDPIDASYFSNITRSLITRGWENWRQSCVDREFILKIKFNSKKQIKI